MQNICLSQEKNIDILNPIIVASNRREFERGMHKKDFLKLSELERKLIDSADSDSFTVDGYCVPCNKKVPFLVDMQSGGQIINHKRAPNWRERLVCSHCQMNNRQRLIATLIKQHLDNGKGKQVYFMKQVTPIYQWAIKSFPQHNIIGSEYLGYEYAGGAVVKGIRHEDVENLSFADDQLDLIISNDVFEHVLNLDKAFSECARVLKAGGVMLATIPFHSENDASVVRAKLSNGQLEHFLPQAYHGNPVSADGSLVFTDFGWDLLVTMKEADFSDVAVDVYAKAEFGHLGGGQIVFRSIKY